MENNLLEEKIEKYINEMISLISSHDDFLILVGSIIEFLENPYDDAQLELVEDYELKSTKFFEVPASLENINDDLLQKCVEDYVSNKYASCVGYIEVRDNTISVAEFLGSCIIFNMSYVYCIMSRDFAVKRDHVENENHAWAIIEKSIRDRGESPPIVKIDQYNAATLLSSPFSKLTDDEVNGLYSSFEKLHQSLKKL